MLQAVLCSFGWHSKDRVFIGKSKARGREAYRFYCPRCQRDFTRGKRPDQ